MQPSPCRERSRILRHRHGKCHGETRKSLSKECIKTLGKDSRLCLNGLHQILLERGCPYNTQDSCLLCFYLHAAPAAVRNSGKYRSHPRAPEEGVCRSISLRLKTPQSSTCFRTTFKPRSKYIERSLRLIRLISPPSPRLAICTPARVELRKQSTSLREQPTATSRVASAET